MSKSPAHVGGGFVGYRELRRICIEDANKFIIDFFREHVSRKKYKSGFKRAPLAACAAEDCIAIAFGGANSIELRRRSIEGL